MSSSVKEAFCWLVPSAPLAKAAWDYRPRDSAAGFSSAIRHSFWSVAFFSSSNVSARSLA